MNIQEIQLDAEVKRNGTLEADDKLSGIYESNIHNANIPEITETYIERNRVVTPLPKKLLEINMERNKAFVRTRKLRQIGAFVQHILICWAKG